MNPHSKKYFGNCVTLVNPLLVMVVFAVIFISSCSSLQAGMYLLSIDNLDGETIKKNESLVKKYLEAMLDNPELYTMKVFERNGIHYQFKRTRLMYHSFYVILDEAGDFHTLSFYGTKIAFYSDGSWVMDGDSDKQSYVSYREEENRWDVVEVPINNGINVQETVKKIIHKMESNIAYYYRDHLKDKPGFDNCTTALYETLVEKTPF